MGYAGNRKPRGLPVAFIAFVILVATVMIAAATGPVVWGQDTNQIGRLYITDSNTERFPSIQLQTYGMDGQGNPIDFSVEPLFVSHNGFPVDEVVFEGKNPVGTLTVFLIDAAGGTSDALPAVQNAISQYASAGNMQEPIDFVAIYQNRTDGPQQLLPPSQFFNSVNNLFAQTPLVAEQGATSLYDSVIELIGQVEGLKPDPGMAASIVLISDGTDPGTSQARPEDVMLQASSAGIPIHTLHIENSSLGPGLELGRTYLRDLATGSRGVAAELADAAGIAAVWARIAGFRDQSLIRYTVPEPAGGTFPVELSLENNRDTRASTEVTVSSVAPNVVINLPRESRSLTVTDLEEPVRLQLSTTVTWLDGQEREVTSAQLLVNGLPVADIPVDSLASFDVEISNFSFGDNRLEVIATDSQELTSTSAPVIIAVAQGQELVVPEELQPAGGGFNWTWLLWLLVLALLAVVGLWLWRRRAGGPPAASGRRSRRRTAPRPAAEPSAEVYPTGSSETTGMTDYAAAGPKESPFVMAHLEVLEASTIFTEDLILNEPEVRIGRSHAQSQIVFRDDITVSRYHAVLRLEGSRYRIFDVGSTSGTYVNDRQVPEYGQELLDGDEIQLGAVRLRYRQL